MPLDHSKIIYLHGLESTSHSVKARQFVQKLPGMLTPEFTGSFEERMNQLRHIVADKSDWTIIGSSFGGLTGVIFTLDHPTQVRKLILLAPALMLEPFSSRPEVHPVSVPTVLIHGALDDVVPLQPVHELAKKAFSNITYYDVDDTHRLHKAFNELDWEQILL